MWEEILKEVEELSLLENKSIERRVVKFNEEFGEFSAELIKMFGDTPKPYNEDNLIKEAADSTIVLFSIILKTFQRQGIPMEKLYLAMKEKNLAWRNKIPNYRSNLE